MSRPWKWDVTIYDRPGWKTLSNNHQRVHLLPDGRLGMQVWSTPASLTATDFWKEQLDDRTLVSEDGGRSWQTADFELPPRRSAKTPSGRTVSIRSVEVVRPQQEIREHLERSGLGHLYKSTTFYQYQLWPERMREELVQQGYLVHEAGNGVLAIAPGQTLCISDDGGQTWSYRELTEMPFHAKLGGFFRDPVVTPGGAILGPSTTLSDRVEPGFAKAAYRDDACLAAHGPKLSLVLTSHRNKAVPVPGLGNTGTFASRVAGPLVGPLERGMQGGNAPLPGSGSLP